MEIRPIMKHLFALIWILLCGSTLMAQYNNEWIDPSKPYYKFRIGKTGLYRIPASTLQSAGLGNIPMEKFQLFRNGMEIAMFSTKATGIAGSSDFLEFYGEMNDGKQDAALYRNNDLQPDYTWSLLTDTATFFLTVNEQATTARINAVSNDVASNTLPPEDFFYHTHLISYRKQLNPGFAAVTAQAYVYSSSFDAGEGWSSADIYPNTPLTETLISHAYAGGPDAVMETRASGNAPNNRNLQVLLNGNLIVNQAMNAFSATSVYSDIPISMLGRSSGDQILIRNASAASTDRMVVSSIRLIYPRVFNFGGSRQFSFQLSPNPMGTYLEISNFNSGSSKPVLLDLSNLMRYEAVVEGGLVKFALKPSDMPRDMVLLNAEPTEIGNIGKLEVRNFIDLSQVSAQGDYLIITHPKLFTAPGGNPIEQYRTYRASASGGNFNAQVFDISQLTDQFGYGIYGNPLAIKNFIRFARDNFATKPKYILLIGRGMLYNDLRNFEYLPITRDMNLIPTFGSPGSDNLLVSPGFEPVTDIPIGRIAAVNGEEVKTYLQKVIEYEAAPSAATNTIADRAWMKNIVHAIGGSDPFLQSVIVGYMNNNRKIIQDTAIGARVFTFSKTSAQTVEQLTTDQLANLFREGIGMLTYFGHSSTNILEFNIDEPSKYANKGKYPLFIVNGCNAGNIFSYDTLRMSSPGATLSEKFMLAKDAGSIGFLASSHFGVVNYLNIYTNSFYKSKSLEGYGKTLGQVQQSALGRLIQATGISDFYGRIHAEQINLHGDPAVQLYASSQPDFVIEDPLMKIIPTTVSVADNNFTVNAGFRNIGKAISDSFRVKIQRQLPSGQITEIYNARLRSTRNLDSIALEVPINPLTEKGENKIIVTLDADASISESSESNNVVSKTFMIIEDELRPISPYNFAIVNKPNVPFYASVANPFAPIRQYVLEVDTTESFNSNFKKTITTQGTGGLLQFNVPTLSIPDGTVCYWRTAPVPPTGSNYIWNNSSFVYLNQSPPGFNQSHFFQFTKNKFNNIILKDDRSFIFKPLNKTLRIKTGLYPAFVGDQLLVTLDETNVVNYGCRYGSIQVVVYDKITLKPWANSRQPNGLGRFNSWPPCIHNDFAFEFPYNDPVYRKRAIDFLASIPDGSYFSISNLGADFNTSFISQWMSDSVQLGSGKSLYHTLKNLGFTSIDQFTKNVPFLFVGRKGTVMSTLYEQMGTNLNDYIETSLEIAGSEVSGTIESPWFGPALSWNRITWAGTDLNPTSDRVRMEIIGKNYYGTETSLATIFSADTSLSFIDPRNFPYLKIRMLNADSLNGTPNQLRNWRILATPVPEGAIAPNILISAKDSVDIGEPYVFELAFKNISPAAFDSIRVNMTLTNAANVTTRIELPKLKPLKEGDTTTLRHVFDTKPLVGANTMFLNINPENAQPEQYLFNNFLYKSFFVKDDNYRPVMDVTFDGVHILNQDIVSSKPNILVKLTDNSKFLMLDDTSLITVKVRYPDNQVRRFRFDNDTLRFIPARFSNGAQQNTASVEFNPYFSQDGFYELIVTGTDKRGNTSGQIEYKVLFSVVNKAMISNLLNYPNPFSTSTAFVFTLTGSQIPQNMRIQILTVTGKVVREITMQELGPIRIGRNITDFKWDGTDQFGQRLANGVYLYRVITNLNGNSLEKLKLTGANAEKYGDGLTDRYFTGGYGKMYLMR